ncbi:MAG: hypothetical protein MN733_03170 [Nitrososphaera sp.]|nr:hypothetical protein [Nitrososphaera sp.]
MTGVPSNALNQLVSDAIARVGQVDLSVIKQKLTNKEHGSGWSDECAEEAEKLYRYFLALQCVYATSEPPVVPPKIADEFWHQHILDTRKYEADCSFLFGRFLHHFPYFGMRGPDDARALDRAGEWTFSLFKRHFGRDVQAGSICSGSCSSCKGG